MNLDPMDISLLKTNQTGSQDEFHIFPTNAEVTRHNKLQFDKLVARTHVYECIDFAEWPESISSEAKQKKVEEIVGVSTL